MNNNYHSSHTGQKTMDWRALNYFNLYRILLSGLFVVLVHIGQLPALLGSYDARLFPVVSYSYLITAILFGFFIYHHVPRFNLQIAFQVLTDIVMLSLLMYSGGGLSSGFGMLIIIAVAGGSILRTGKIAILFAALATIAVLGHELYLQFISYRQPVNYTHAGILGVIFFITAFVGNMLSARVRESEALAVKQALELDELAGLNEHIVQRVQSGIVVLDHKMRILLINESAKRLLGQQDDKTNRIAGFIDRYLTDLIAAWLATADGQDRIIKIAETNTELQVSFIKLVIGRKYRVLIFLEDMAQLRQRVQHLKLASLGRLTASIAHEIRNPLGAINHAGQLLRESDSLGREDKRLTEIINDHSNRVNSIIENILSISRREKTTPEQIEIVSWLDDFIDEFQSRQELPGDSIKLICAENTIPVWMDASQLHQVLWNLCENALRYNNRRHYPVITFTCDVNAESRRPYIDIIDRGSGIRDDVKGHIFEPFFTTEPRGSGLGLYLARELCEANRATLGLLSTSAQGTTFRLSFMPAYIDKQTVRV